MLAANDIADVVGEQVALKPAGREFKCLCPFHDDRSPSMCVVPHKQIFHCFVCGTGGNAIDFVMKYHGMSFREALEFLAQRAGIELTPFRPSGANAGQQRSQEGPSREELSRVCGFAQQFFRTILNHPEHGASARAIIDRRGIAPEMVEAFGIGAAPARWDGLVRTAEARGEDQSLFDAAGLFKSRDDGGRYDVFRNRLVFPIFDQANRPVAFGGRRIDEEDNPKYLNSPETPLFNKSATLYGLAQANRAIRASRRVIVTEGYTDVVACHQHGFTNVVATLGTALTTQHARILRRLCDEVVLLFDGDEAGQRAADRALEVFFPESMDVRVVVLPGGADPDEVLSAPGGHDSFQSAIEGGEDVLAHRMRRLAQQLDEQGHGVGSAGRSRLVEQMLQRLSELGLANLPPIRRRTVIDRIASIAGVDPQTIAQAAKSTRRPRAADPTADEPIGAPVRPQTPAEHALGCLLADETFFEIRAEQAQQVCRAMERSGRFGVVAASVRSALNSGQTPELVTLLGTLDAPADRSAAVALAESARTLGGDDIVAHFDSCFERLRLSDALHETKAHRDADPGDALAAAINARRRVGANAGGIPRAAGRVRRTAAGVADPARNEPDHTKPIAGEQDAPGHALPPHHETDGGSTSEA